MGILRDAPSYFRRPDEEIELYDSSDDLYSEPPLDDDEYEEPEIGTIEDRVNSLGVTIYSSYEGDGVWLDGYTDPGWQHIFTIDGDGVYCPYCDDSLRYHDGVYCCISCDMVFSKEDVDEYVEIEWYVR